jgi:hypothetical protein
MSSNVGQGRAGCQNGKCRLHGGGSDSVFTAEIHQWWPLAGFSVCAELRRGNAEFCAIEPRVGGRV